MKRLAILVIFLCGQLVFPAKSTGSQQQQSQVSNPSQITIQSDGNTPLYRFTVNVVQRSTVAINYQHRSGSTLVDLRGTGLLPESHGQAKVEGKKGYTEIEVEFDELQAANRFGPEFLTYVLWAITPEGRATSLGEVILGGSEAKLNVSTELQTFALVVTAEPYFAVSQPSDVVVMENVVRKDTTGKFEFVDAKYELLKRGEYTANVLPADLKPMPKDKQTPLDLLEARNAVRIAEWSGAEKHAGESMRKARQLLNQAEVYHQKKSDSKALAMSAREAVQTAEDARLITLKRLEEIRIAEERRVAELRVNEAAAKAAMERQRAEQEAALRSRAMADEAAARANAAQARQEARTAEEQARAAKEAANADIERSRKAAAEAQEKARQARAMADADVERAELAARQALLDKTQAEDEKKRIQAQSEQEKAALRQQLAEQLGRILETRDSARGLIVSLSDVQFDFDKYTLRPETREKLAKLSGVLLSHPGLTIEVEGHTDDVGTDAYNQKLSEQRAEQVKTYLMQQGLSMIAARGFGKAQPLVPNDSSANRQRNRRVEMIVSGEFIITSSQRLSSSR
jgi:outer membrane protein OmpA-like peptidoglycan-associated protein